ncbi:uncharacterized protein LOC143044445 isoform X2 [Mytilus galloprovincialis]|uniref:uncharacterized protein LOC143044445 isoform X2 n=1 Tax=Mytilus galloprovincialis TaxID=29158 RepID=UPI003F7CC029
MMRRFFLLFVYMFMRRYCLTLALSDNITKSTSMPDDSENEINKYLCQENNLNITCPNNFVISFDDANFGRGRSDSRCSQFWGIESIPCDNNEQTLKVLNNKCHEEQKCFLPVEKSIFGNPCTGVTKYLYVKYHCERKVNHVINTTISFQSVNDKLGQSSTNKPEQELTIVGIVLGVVLALIFLLIGALLLKRFRQLNQRKGILRIEEIEMNIESENQNQYDYSEVTAQSICNYANQTSAVPNRLHQAENEYEVSAHVPSRTKDEPLTYDVHVSDNTYNVTETSGNEPKGDVNNTYDHFLGEQTEDKYDIADNKVMNRSQCKTDEDLYY